MKTNSGTVEVWRRCCGPCAVTRRWVGVGILCLLYCDALVARGGELRIIEAESLDPNAWDGRHEVSSAVKTATAAGAVLRLPAGTWTLAR